MRYLRGPFYLTAVYLQRTVVALEVILADGRNWKHRSGRITDQNQYTQECLKHHSRFFMLCRINLGVVIHVEILIEEVGVHTLQDTSQLCLRTCWAHLWQGSSVSRTQWGVLYSEASSPWRHLDKVRPIVCFCFLLFLVHSSTAFQMEEYGKAGQEDGPSFFWCVLLKGQWQDFSACDISWLPFQAIKKPSSKKPKRLFSEMFIYLKRQKTVRQRDKNVPSGKGRVLQNNKQHLVWSKYKSTWLQVAMNWQIFCFYVHKAPHFKCPG